MGQNGQLSTPVSRFAQPDAYLAAIIESSDDAIIGKSMDGMITSWNRSAERIFGYKEEEAVGKPITLIIPPERLDEEDHIMATLRQGKRLDHFETVRVAKDGHRVDLSETISPIKNDAGKIIGISKVGRDISSRKDLERQLQTQIHKLEQTNNEIKDMTSLAAHDLKEPLRGLSMKASMLLEDYGGTLDAEGCRKLKDLIKLSQRSHKLIEDLLNFSRVGRIDVPDEEINPNETIKGISHMIEERLKEKNAKISVPRPLPVFVGDKKGITEVIRNLITNAVIYNDKPAPVVEIGYQEEMDDTPHGPQKNVFYVRDNGIGIPPEFHQDIFRLFKRLPASQGYNDGGTGLGLALVKKILDQCNGHIWLESEIGKGTVFYFTVGDCVSMTFHDRNHSAAQAGPGNLNAPSSANAHKSPSS
jgi:PAS domain S-box-containing protein